MKVLHDYRLVVSTSGFSVEVFKACVMSYHCNEDQIMLPCKLECVKDLA